MLGQSCFETSVSKIREYKIAFTRSDDELDCTLIDLLQRYKQEKLNPIFIPLMGQVSSTFMFGQNRRRVN